MRSRPALPAHRQQLFPFSLWSVARLALVAILAGNATSALLISATGDNSPHTGPRSVRVSRSDLSPLDPGRIAQFAGSSPLLSFCSGPVLRFLYINSVFRFILFESVLRKECSISDGCNDGIGPEDVISCANLSWLISTALVLRHARGIPLVMMGAAVDR